MELSRKRKRELKKLRNSTETLLAQQKDVLSNANAVFSEATRQARALNAEKVMPRVNETVSQIRPHVDKSVNAARQAATRAKIAVTPVVATALAKTVSALSNIEATNQTAEQLQSFGEQRGILAKPKKKRASKIFAIGLGLTAAAGIAYTLWNTFKEEDEDMWVSTD